MGRPANVSAQLAYAQRTGHWQFSALWYEIRRDFYAGGKRRTLDILVLDTVVLCGIGTLNHFQTEQYIDDQLEFLGQGKADHLQPGALRGKIAEQQWAWLEGKLNASKADYLWVTGHYPIWSVGSDGSTQCLISRLQPLLQQYGAHYISGHDHNLEHFVHNETQMFVAGAGKACCYPPDNLNSAP